MFIKTLEQNFLEISENIEQVIYLNKKLKI